MDKRIRGPLNSSTAGRVETVRQLLFQDVYDEQGNFIESIARDPPLISREESLALVEFPDDTTVSTETDGVPVL